MHIHIHDTFSRICALCKIGIICTSEGLLKDFQRRSLDRRSTEYRNDGESVGFHPLVTYNSNTYDQNSGYRSQTSGLTDRTKFPMPG